MRGKGAEGVVSDDAWGVGCGIEGWRLRVRGVR